MNKDILKLFSIFFLGFLGGILSNLFFYQEGIVYTIEREEVYIEENRAIIDSLKRVSDSVIGLKSVSPRGSILESSGIIISSDGLAIVLSSYMPENYETSIFLNGQILSYETLKRNEELALIKLEGDNFTTLGLKRIEDVVKGERVFLVGAVFYNNYFEKFINEGIVKRTNKYIYTNIRDKGGSILFNISGEIIGINLLENEEIVSISSNTIREFAEI